MTPARVLVVEDDARLGELLKRGLAEEGFVVELVVDGAAGLERALSGRFDLFVIDGTLPSLDGFDLIRRSCAAGVAVPSLILTARDAVSDRVEGLDAGADDYLVKPFAFAELVARLRALLRRTPPKRCLRWRDLEVDVEKHGVRKGGLAIDLSAKQFGMLELLVQLRGDVATRMMLLEQVFGYRFDPGTNIIDVHISHLRQRIDVAGEPSMIETVRGVGYRLAHGA